LVLGLKTKVVSTHISLLILGENEGGFGA